MNRRPIHTAYCHFNGDYPCSVNMDTAVAGLNDIGIKIVPFQEMEDVETDAVACGPEAMVAGFIGDVKLALKKMGLPMPPELDYPEELKEFYGRDIWTGTLKDVKEWPVEDKGPVFVKSTRQKLITGLIWHKTKANRLTLATYDEDTPVFMSNVVNFISESRCYILDGKILDVKRYKGSYSVGPAEEVVEAAVAAYKGPRAYVIDFGVTKEGQTLIVEVNDGFAMGNYGLHAIAYARMLEARWEELTEPLLCN